MDTLKVLQLATVTVGIICLCLISSTESSQTMDVCPRTKLEYYYVSQQYTTYHVWSRGYSTGCGWWGRRCSRTRYGVETRTSYRSVRKSRYRVDSYYCCRAYEGTYPNCEPICNPRCEPHGRCKDVGSINVCECHPGWEGPGCETAICTDGCVNGMCDEPDKCTCYDGWTGNNCTQDINECANNNGDCEHVCKNTEGSYHCLCREGYVLDGDRHSCLDVDECVTGTHNCTGLAQCRNLIGGFRCSCPDGYVVNDTDYASCDDYDECFEGSPISECSQVCENTEGSYSCSCFQGYFSEDDGKNCSDINECAVERGGCEHYCVNEPGGFHCECAAGHVLKQDGKGCEELICSVIAVEEKYDDTKAKTKCICTV